MAAPPKLLSGPWTRLVSIQEQTDDTMSPATGVLAALAAAHGRGEPIQFLIGRGNARTGQCVWATGNLVTGLSADGNASFPAGGRSTAIDRTRLDRLTDAISAWCHGTVDLRPRDVSMAPSGIGPEDVIYADASASAVWLVTARPVGGADLKARRDSIGLRITRAQAGSAAQEADAARDRSLLELVDDRSVFGLWELSVACGSDTPGQAAAVLFGLSQMRGVSDAPVQFATDPTESGWLGTAELGALVQPPSRELPGIRMIERPGWDQSIETDGTDGLALGQLVGEDDATTAVRLSVTRPTINRHAFVTGATGSGKSETVRTLLEELSSACVPWLVIEPAKSEYHLMGSRVAPASVLTIRPGDPTSPAGGLNPLEPSVVAIGGARRRFPLQTHVDLVRGLFEAAFDAEEPFPQILAAALDRSYTALGWDLATGQRRRAGAARRGLYPTLGELRRHALAVVDDAGYGREVRDNVRGFIEVRLGSLESGSPGRFFERAHRLDLQALARRNVVLQIEDIGNDRDQAFLIGAVILRWVEMLRMANPGDGHLRHVMVIEEAHRLLRHDTSNAGAAHSVEMLANLLAEVRAYGQGLVIAEQIPSKITPDVVKNSALKIVHRLPSADDREFVGATMNLDEDQSRAVVAFVPGEAAVHADGMDRPVRVRIRPPQSGSAAVAPVEPAAMKPRNSSCAATCAQHPCSAMELAVSARVRSQWEIRVWTDLTVLAHLLGKPLPSLRTVHRDNVMAEAGADPHRLQCGVADLCSASVRARWVDVAPYNDPDELIQVATAAATHYLRSGSWQSERADVRWQVRNSRWMDIEDELVRALADAPGSTATHPSTREWQTRAPELELPGSPMDSQLTHVRHRHAEELRDGRALLWGAPSVLRIPQFADDVAGALRRIGVIEPWVTNRFVPPST